MPNNMIADTNANVTGAIRPDGFLDFYEMLGLPGNATESLITERINDLYSKARENREHRHLAKRRESELLLDLLPHALNVLSIPENRTRYDSYAAGARASAPVMDFETFMNTVIKGTSETEQRKGMLGMRSEPLSAALSVTPSVSFGSDGTSMNAATMAPPAVAVTTGSASSAVSVSGTATAVPLNSPAPPPMVASSLKAKFPLPMASLVFVATFVASDTMLNLSPVLTILLSSLIAVSAGIIRMMMAREIEQPHYNRSAENSEVRVSL